MSCPNKSKIELQKFIVIPSAQLAQNPMLAAALFEIVEVSKTYLLWWLLFL